MANGPGTGEGWFSRFFKRSTGASAVQTPEPVSETALSKPAWLEEEEKRLAPKTLGELTGTNPRTTNTPVSPPLHNPNEINTPANDKRTGWNGNL